MSNPGVIYLIGIQGGGGVCSVTSDSNIFYSEKAAYAKVDWFHSKGMDYIKVFPMYPPDWKEVPQPGKE
jgi:hypothetical protein